METTIIVPQRGALASTLGHLLLDAIDDARSLDPALFHLDMSGWVIFLGPSRPANSVRCEVCLAGASMVCRLNAANVIHGDHYTEIIPDDFESEERRLRAINRLRCGQLHAAYRCLYRRSFVGDIPDDLTDLLAQAEGVSTEPWVNDWAAHLALARRLIELGL